MTELDLALEKYLQDENQQGQYYQTIVMTEFLVPLVDGDAGEEQVTPLIMETDGKPYLMLFDSEERVSSWAKSPVKYMHMTGSGLAKISTEGLHWAINIGGKYAKEFIPAEIEYLKTL